MEQWTLYVCHAERKFLEKEKTQVLSVYNILRSFAFVAKGLSMGTF